MSNGNSQARSQIFITLLLCTKLFITNNFVKGDFHISFTLRSNYYKLSMCLYGPKHGTLLVYLIDFHYFHPILQVLFIEKDNLYTINVTILIFFIRLNDTDQLLLQIPHPVLSGGEGFGLGFPTIFIWTIFPRWILFFSANMKKILHEYKT